MVTQTLKLNVKSGEKDGKNFWDRCGVLFVNTDDTGNITSINVKHSMFPRGRNGRLPAPRQRSGHRMTGAPG